MAVMNTESRLPAGYAPEDLGQAAIKVGTYEDSIPELGNLYPGLMTLALVSYLRTPITKGSLNEYVLFVLDADLAPNVATYNWQVLKSTDVGVVSVPVYSETTEEGCRGASPAASVEGYVKTRRSRAESTVSRNRWRLAVGPPMM